jgi:fibronectin-binding autotransporter adhesin
LKKALQKLKLVFFFALSLLLSLVDMAYAEPAVNALPTGGQVISGDASIATSGATLNVNQTSQRAIVNWDSFNVGKDATVNFNQPNSSASTLNRISSGTPSQIYGKINAVGEVILQNTAGVYFSKSASLDVGSIAATTHTISNDDFNNGKYHFDRNGSTGSVINEGHIKAGLNGYVAMLAPEVRNSGLIVAQMGTVVMAAGERVTLNFDTSSHLASITTTPATINTLIENKSAVTVNGGTIILSAKAVNTLVSGVIKQSGTLDASNVANKLVSVGGRIMIDGDDVNIATNSETLAHGSVKGGSVAITASRSLTTEAKSKINVSAIESGNGGSIKTTAPSTSLAGDMVALGGASSGKGGVIETNADSLTLANTSSVNANNQDGISDKGTWTINLPNLTMTNSFNEVISNTLNTTNVKLNLLTSSFNLLKDQVIEKIAGAKTLFEINTKTQMNIAGNISSDASAPLDLILTSYESILVSSSSTINIRNIDAEAPTISVAGNLNAYGNSNQGSSPFMALLGARLAIAGNLRSGSKQNSGRILLKGSDEVNINSSGNILTEGHDGGWIKILSDNGSVNIVGTIMTNGESGRGGTIHINASQNILMSNTNLLANGISDGGLIVVASNNGDVNFQQSFIQTNGGAGVGGTILLSGVNNTLISSTEISARGYIQGGTIKVGNDLANQFIPFSRYTEIDSNSVLNASQINSNIQNNQGGLIETSASTVNLLGSINAGRGGMWLLDPFNITIDSTKASYIKTVLDAGSSVTISTASASNTVGLNSISGSSGLGNITIDAAISSSGAGASLTLIAANDIYVNQAITLSGAGSSVTFTANNTNLTSNITTYGNQTFNSNIRLYSGITLTSNGGDVNITGNVIGISGLIEFLGGGIYKYNGTSYTVGVGSSPINVLYNSSTSTYSWQAQSTSAEVLLVAGGGGGGMDIGGGGGGGGVISTTVVTASQTWYEIKVGAGGSGAPAGCSGAQACDHNFTINATAGGNSTMQNAGATIIAIGGGYGGTSYWTSPLGGQGGSGGSGGGAAGYNAGTSGKNGSGTAGQGFAGASGYNSHVSGGGGGAGAPGNTGGSNGASSGGAGIENCILGTCYYWGGGGGGSGHSYTGGNGGIGGGGGGAVGTTTGGTGYNNGSAGGAGCINCQAQSPGGNGGANTGGGGGGGSHYNRTNQGGNGGSGIAVLKYNGSLIINSGAGSVALGGTVADGALTINSNSISNSIAGAISGAMSLTKLGTGSLTLNGTGSSYTGATTISAGAIKLGAADVISNSSAVNLAGSLDLNGFSETIGSLSGAGTITSSTSGTVTITIGADNASTSFTGVIEKGSATSLALTKSGSGTLTLSGNNTYDGGTNINAGVLSLASANAIGSSGTISFGGGTLQYTSSNTTDYSGRISSASGQAFKVDTNGNNVTWATSLTNASSSITKSGAGTWTLGVIDLTNATFNQGSVVATSISINGTSSVGGTITTSGVVSFAGASTLVRDTTITSGNNNVSFGSTINGEYELVINAGSGVASFGGAIGLTNAVARFEVTASGGINVGGDIKTVMGLVDGLYFEKFSGQAYGNMQFYNTATRRNINDGHATSMPTSSSNPITTINAANGTVAVTTATSTSIYVCPTNDCDSNYSVRATGYYIAPTSGTYTFATYADDDHYLFMGTANESISDFITRVQSSSATPNVGERGLVVRAPGCCSTITGTVALVAGNRYPLFATFNEGGGGDYMWTKFMLPGQSSYVTGVRGEVSNGLGYYYNSGFGSSSSRAGIYLSGNTTLTAASAMTSSNATVSIAGTLTSDATRNLTVDTSTFTVGNVSSMGAVSISASSLTAGNFSSVNTLALNATTINAGTYDVNQSITFNNSGAQTVSNTISGNGKLIKTGTGVLTVTGNNSFLGGVDINDGTLNLGSTNAIGSTGTISFGGGTLQYTSSNTTDYSSRFSTASSQAYKVDTNGQNITWASGLTSSGGSLLKSGSGTLTLSGDNSYSGITTLSVGNITISGNNSTSGAININAGVLSLGSANAIGTSGTISFGGGTLQYTSSNTTDYSSRFSTASSQAYKVDTNGQDIVWATGLTSSGASFVKSGLGKLTISGANSYSGSTTISAGSIKLGRANGLSSVSSIIFSSNTSLDIAGYSQSLGSLSGAGTITSSGSGTLTITIGADNSSTSFSGVIEKGSATSLALTKSGSGTLTLSGSNTYDGGTNINAGVLSLGSANAIGTSGTISFGGGTLQYTSSNTTDYSSRLSGASGQAFKVDTNGRNVTWATDLTNASSSITKSGTGTLTISNSIGASSVNLIVTAGTLSLPGTESQLAGIGTISLQGGTLSCPNCPSLGDVVALANTTLSFSGLNAVFRTLTLASGVTMSAGSITVTGASTLGGSISASSGDINFGGAVTLVAATTITNTDRNVSFGSTVDGFNSLTIRAGTGVVTFNGNIGGTTAIGTLDVVASGGIYLSNITIMGLTNGLYFEKFSGQAYGNMQFYNTASRLNINNGNGATMPTSASNPITTINAANGSVSVTTATSTSIYVCPGTDCDSNYSVRATGYFIAPTTGTYTFATYADDDHYLFMGTANESISDFITRVQSSSATANVGERGLVVRAPGCCATITGTVALVGGNRYPIFATYNEGGGGDYMWTKFMLPGQSSYVAGVRSEVSNGLGYYYSNPNGTSGGGGTTGVALTGPVTLLGNSTITSANAAVTITGAISSDSTPRSLTVDAQTFNAQALTALSGLSITVADTSAITGIISGNMNFTKAGDGLLTLSGANTFNGSTTVSAGTLRLSGSGSSLGMSTNTLTLAGGTLDLVNKALSLSALTMNNSSSSIINSSGTSSLIVLNASSLRGSITTQGTQTYSDGITLTGNMTFASSNNDITFSSTISGAYNLTINSGTGLTRFNGALSNINNLSSLGSTILDRNISTTGTQSYGVTLLNSSVLLSTTNDDITFNSTLKGAYGLTANVGTAKVSFIGLVGDGNLTDALTTLNITGGAYIASNVYTANDQIYSTDITINGAVGLTSLNGNVTLGGNVNAVGSALIAFLGNGVYKFNADTYTATSSLDLITGVSYNSSTRAYSWVAASGSAEILLVAGGGGGGMDMGGGGGGGGVIAGTYSFTRLTSYTLSVGAGGNGAPAGSTPGQPGGHQYSIRATAGGNSTIQHSGGTLTAAGGGYGGSSYWGYTPDYGYGGAGGSGGGASGYSDGNTGRGGAGTSGQGYAGGGGQGQYYAGGGGGAGGAGGSGRSNGSAYGGVGVENCIMGTCYYWGGGGGGASYSAWGGNGGLGGGGGGAVGTTTGGAGYNNGSAGGGGCTNCWANMPGGNAGANTGGGGGGGSHYNANNNGGNGGSGMVVLKYATNNSLTLTANNGRVNLPTDLTLSNINSITMVDGNTSRDLTFNSLTLVNTSLDLVNRKLTAASLITDVNSSITNSSGSAKLHVTGTASIAGSITTGRDYFDVANSLTVKNVTTGLDEVVSTEWGQYYAGAVNLTGTASLISNDYNIGFNSTVQGNYDLTVNAGLGFVMFKNRVGADPLLETNTTVLSLNTTNGNDYVAFGNRKYSAGTSFATSTLRTSANLKSLTVTGDEIFIKADITTDYNQTYTGHVRIGNNGSNGTTRSLISLDPTISFYGRSIRYQTIENGAYVYKNTDNKYTFDDEASTPTHTLVLKAKGYCYVGSSASCGDAGNIRKALDTNGLPSATVLYNSWMPLLDVVTDNKTMLFPSSTYNALTFNLNTLSIPRGTNDGSRNTTESATVSDKSSVNYQFSLRPRSSPVISSTSGTPPGARGFVAGSVGRVASSSDAKSITAFIPVKNNLSGDVVIGNVSASFIDNGSSTSNASTNKSPDCKTQAKAECK